MAWNAPKTNWSATDRFNISDFNRIKNNLTYIYENSQLIWGTYTIADMGDDLSSYESYWDVNMFNAIEQNLTTINSHMIGSDIGSEQTFYVNSQFIGYEELNRIESATLILKATIDGWYEAMAKLAFRLGNKGGIRV